MDEDKLITRQELADFLRVSKRTLQNLRNKLPQPIRVGRLLRYRMADVVAWVNRGGKPADPINPDKAASPRLAWRRK